jgi:hypothetical protein
VRLRCDRRPIYVIKVQPSKRVILCVFLDSERTRGSEKLFTGVLTQDLNLRPGPPLQVLGLSKTPGQVGSQVRVSRKTQVRSRS